ncbi:hypothetical protein F4776DRAFT_369525 [Hypoxylon sp. NC0597]|nr:hypothetical protein F4776DRAFT_369525 [Hypoxylon sp. NC0597]
MQIKSLLAAVLLIGPNVLAAPATAGVVPLSEREALNSRNPPGPPGPPGKGPKEDYYKHHGHHGHHGSDHKGHHHYGYKGKPHPRSWTRDEQENEDSGYEGDWSWNEKRDADDAEVQGSQKWCHRHCGHWGHH